MPTDQHAPTSDRSSHRLQPSTLLGRVLPPRSPHGPFRRASERTTTGRSSGHRIASRVIPTQAPLADRTPRMRSATRVARSDRANPALIELCDNRSAGGASSRNRSVWVNILVAENKDATATSLRQAGHHVTVARSGRDLCALTRSGSFDALVIGILRPGDQTLTLCDALRRECVRLPIVLIVAEDAVDDRIEGLNAGADDCVGTGCPADELLARLRALVCRNSPPAGPR